MEYRNKNNRIKNEGITMPACEAAELFKKLSPDSQQAIIDLIKSLLFEK